MPGLEDAGIQSGVGPPPSAVQRGAPSPETVDAGPDRILKETLRDQPAQDGPPRTPEELLGAKSFHEVLAPSGSLASDGGAPEQPAPGSESSQPGSSAPASLDLWFGGALPVGLSSPVRWTGGGDLGFDLGLGHLRLMLRGGAEAPIDTNFEGGRVMTDALKADLAAGWAFHSATTGGLELAIGGGVVRLGVSSQGFTAADYSKTLVDGFGEGEVQWYQPLGSSAFLRFGVDLQARNHAESLDIGRQNPALTLPAFWITPTASLGWRFL